MTRCATLASIVLASCATAPPFPVERYFASGSEPFWSLVIDNGRIGFDSTIEPPVEMALPPIRRAANGYRIQVQMVRIDILRRPCEDEDARIYPHTVRAIAPGYALRGCGGPPMQAPDR